jgi:hypothetical protein
MVGLHSRPWRLGTTVRRGAGGCVSAPEAFAERARGEQLATGEAVRKRAVETRKVLNAQEGQIVRLAAERHTNPEIAGQLFITAATLPAVPTAAARLVSSESAARDGLGSSTDAIAALRGRPFSCQFLARKEQIRARGATGTKERSS